jgi:hypothetical protein
MHHLIRHSRLHELPILIQETKKPSELHGPKLHLGSVLGRTRSSVQKNQAIRRVTTVASTVEVSFSNGGIIVPTRVGTSG